MFVSDQNVAMSREVVQALGIDVGSTNTKVVLVEIRTGDVWPQVVERSVVSGPTPATAPAPVALVVDLTAQAVASRPVPQPVGVAMAKTGVPLGPDGAPLTPLLRWDGHRAAEEAQARASTYGSAALFAATGVRPSPLAVLGGPAMSDPAWAATKRRVQADPLRWVTVREPVATGAALLAATRAGLLGDTADGRADATPHGDPARRTHPAPHRHQESHDPHR